MDEEEETVRLGWLGLVEEVDHYAPVLGVEDKFWNLKPDVRLTILDGWLEAVEILIEGNEEFGRTNEDVTEVKTAIILQFPDVQ